MCTRVWCRTRARPFFAELAHVRQRESSRPTDAACLLPSQTIQETLAEIIPGRQAIAKELRTTHGHKVLGEVTVEQVFGALRSPRAPGPY